MSAEPQQPLTRTRRWNTWSTAGAIALIVVLLAAIALIGNWNLFTGTRWSQGARGFTQLVKQTEWFEGMLRQGRRGTPPYEAFLDSARVWVARVLPDWLEIAQDTDQRPAVRVSAVMKLGTLFGQTSRLSDIAREFYPQMIEVLTECVNEEEIAVRMAAAFTLRQLGVDPHVDWPSHLELAHVSDSTSQTVLFGGLVRRLMDAEVPVSAGERTQILDQLMVLLHGDRKVGLTVAAVLIKEGDTRVVPWLIDRLESPRWRIRLGAQTQLEILSKEALGLDPAAWRLWWEEHQEDEFLPIRPTRTPLDALRENL